MTASPATPDPVRFRAVLTPNRSLSPTGFLVLMALIAVVNVVTGVAFLLLGAWPVFFFCGLDVALIYLAFRINYRDGRLSETIELARSSLTLVRAHPSGAAERFEFHPYWARVQLRENSTGRSELRLASHGRELVFAAFLGDDERREFAAVLAAELQAIKSAASSA